MRQLDPKVAQDRKHKVLQWVVHNYIRTSRPIASANVAGEAGLDLSSATIRSVLKDLEDEGYLGQVHASSGRVPTDRGYRFYVDYLHDVQRLASNEKARIEKQYTERLSELDNLLAQTSRVLSHLTNKAGLVLSPKLQRETLKRIELIPLGAGQVLAIVVTQNGMIRHWPIRLSFTPSPNRLTSLNRFLNEHVSGKSVAEVRRTLAGRIESAERELRELHDLAGRLLDEIGAIEVSEKLYLDGAMSLVSDPEGFGDLAEIQSLMRVMDERRSLARILEDEFSESEQEGAGRIRVRIGAENRLPELQRLSLVTTTYSVGGKMVGVLGVLGDRRMEYSRMISLVDYIGSVVSRSLSEWEGLERNDAEG